MPSIEARISTDQPDRFLRQFGKHATAMASPRGHLARMPGGNPLARGVVRLRVAATDTLTTVHFAPWGSCTLRVEPATLVVRIDATDDPGLQQIRDTITRDLSRFGRGQLVVDWRSGNGSASGATADAQ